MMCDSSVIRAHEGLRRYSAEACPGAGQSFNTAGLFLIPNTGGAELLPALRRISMLIIVPIIQPRLQVLLPKTEGFGFVSNNYSVVVQSSTNSPKEPMGGARVAGYGARH